MPYSNTARKQLIQCNVSVILYMTNNHAQVVQAIRKQWKEEMASETNEQQMIILFIYLFYFIYFKIYQSTAWNSKTICIT